MIVLTQGNKCPEDKKVERDGQCRIMYDMCLEFSQTLINEDRIFSYSRNPLFLGAGKLFGGLMYMYTNMIHGIIPTEKEFNKVMEIQDRKDKSRVEINTTENNNARNN